MQLSALSLCMYVIWLVWPGSARADDWLAVLPACVPSAPELPSFVLHYPRAGLPAVLEAGDAIVARVRLPAALTPPPGVQQRRALAGWRGELVGHALAFEPARALEHRYALEVVDVRPLGPSSLFYRVKLPTPAWTAPGTYDFALVGPGGSARVLASVRVLARGRPPRLAWLGARAQLSSLAAASLPIDVFVSRELPAATHPAAAPVLTLGTAAALRLGGELLVLGECATEYLSFADEIRGVEARERRARRELPVAPALAIDQFQSWGSAARPLPSAADLAVSRAAAELQMRVAPAFPGRAELGVLVSADHRSTTSGALEFFPAGERLERTARPALVGMLSASAPGVAVRRRRAAPLHARLELAPERAVVLKPVSISVRAPGVRAPARVALRIDPLATYFTSAPVTHRFAALERHNLRAWVLAPDGRVAVLEQAVAVHGALAIGCGAVAGCDPAGSWAAAAGGLPSLLALRKRLARRRARNRLAAHRGS